MELTNALNLITTIANNKQQEVDALNLAVKMLQDKFVPELTRMETAETQVNQLNEANIAKDTTIENLTIEKTELQTQIETLAEEKAGLETQVAELSKPVDEPIEKLPAEETLITP